METNKDLKVTKVTPEEAQAFRDRVRKQKEELATWIVIDLGEFLDLFDGGKDESR